MNYDKKKYGAAIKRWPMGQTTHLYELGDDKMDFGYPMCTYGWTDKGRDSYSILRYNYGENGLCKNCLKRAVKGLPGVLPKTYKGDIK